MIYNNDWIW